MSVVQKKHLRIAVDFDGIDVHGTFIVSMDKKTIANLAALCFHYGTKADLFVDRHGVHDFVRSACWIISMRMIHANPYCHEIRELRADTRIAGFPLDMSEGILLETWQPFTMSREECHIVCMPVAYPDADIVDFLDHRKAAQN